MTVTIAGRERVHAGDLRVWTPTGKAEAGLLHWTQGITPESYGKHLCVNGIEAQVVPLAFWPDGRVRLLQGILQVDRRLVEADRYIVSWFDEPLDPLPPRRTPNEFKPLVLRMRVNDTEWIASRWSPVDHRKSGPNLLNKKFWTQMGSRDTNDTLLGIHQEVESRADGWAIIELQITNAVRKATDRTGSEVHGEVYFDEMWIDVPRGYRIIPQFMQPNMRLNRDGTKLYLAQPMQSSGESEEADKHYLTPRSRATYRFALFPTSWDEFAGPEKVASCLIDGIDHAVLEGPQSFFQMGLYGPQFLPLSSPTTSYRYLNLTGIDAMKRCSTDMAWRVKANLAGGNGATGILHGEDWASPNPGGNLHISACSAFSFHPAWTWTVMNAYSKHRRERNHDGCF